MLNCVTICRCHTVWVALCWSGFSRITMGAQYVRHGTLKSFQTWLICSVPQGSVLGLILFILYTNDLIGLAEQHDFCPHLYADNTQVYGSCRPSAVADFQVHLFVCVNNIAAWTMAKHLQLNAGNTDLLWCATAHRHTHQLPTWAHRIGSDFVHSLTSVRNLGIYRENKLTDVGSTDSIGIFRYL